MTFKTSLFLVILFSLISPCISVIGVTNDYKKLNGNQRTLIHNYDLKNELMNGNIYIINAKQLKQELEKYEKSIVYCFTNGCANEYCEPMVNYISFADKNGYKLYLVMNGLGNLSATLDQLAPIPYYTIDQEYYGSKFRSKYTRRFINELLGRDIKYKANAFEGNLFFFEQSSHVDTKMKLLE